MKKIKWGIVGPGRIAHQFASDIKFSKYGEITAVASNNKNRADDFAKQYKIPSTFYNYSDLYNSPDVDAVYVATPHNFHFKNSSDALNAGKAILCEKPLTVNPEEAIELFETAKSNNQYLIEGMWTYFLPAIIKAQEWINEGRIGEVLTVKSDFGYPKPFDPKSRLFNPELAGGSLLDMGIYTLAMARLFMKDDPMKIDIFGHRAPTGADDEVNMLFHYSNSRSASLHTSFRSKLNNHTYIIGEEGYIDIPDFWRAKSCSLFKVEEKVDEYFDNRKGKGFEFEIDAVSMDILENRKTSEVIPPETSIFFQKQMQTILNHF
ncbi:Gfo/Idh/MocA family protein [Marinigracilibium pacificum]|uniref:Gfo/Idh/MocA family oxidoreductase n=1 Tax=Marinigracilibium pacificum TaxID=2729599 RepID=A0A848IV32_9BACT|nr:Gfo/Idh/MocA family oxidoreductase [Marinigracilibium pacificum]NMM47546.1 Gfo/Idh/MocA family oxidoreductase [Marinigracilibium pacificum]